MPRPLCAVIAAPQKRCRRCAAKSFGYHANSIKRRAVQSQVSRLPVEELDALRATETHPQNRTIKRPGGTRGWYDHSSEPVNFLVPLVVTLMFVAIEAILLTTG